MEARFVTPFHDKYQRNNKHTGRKNIRCFPICNPVKHVDNGFCGCPVQISVRGCEALVGLVKVWAQFQQVREADAFSPGQIIATGQISKKERSKQFPMMPWIRGTVYPGQVQFDERGFETMTTNSDEAGTMTVMINMELMGWHYHWVSNKHTNDTFHVLRVYIFAINADNDLRCLSVCSSPKFQITSRRKPKGSSESVDTSTVLSKRKAVEFVSVNPPPSSARERKLIRKQSSCSAQSHALMSMIRHIFIDGAQSMGTVDFSAKPINEVQTEAGLDNFATNLFGNLVCGIDYDFDGLDFDVTEAESLMNHSSSIMPGEEASPRSITAQLARYLVEEESFSKDIGQFFAEAGEHTVNAEVARRLFREFTRLVNGHVEKYLETRGLTMNDLQAEFNAIELRKGKTDVDKLDASNALADDPTQNAYGQNPWRQAFLSRLQRESKPSFVDNSPPPPPEYDFSGVWLNNGKFEDLYKKAVADLTDYGYPIIMVQMVRKMFWRYTVRLSVNYLSLKGTKKWLSNGEVLFRLDNQDHHMDLREMSLGLEVSPSMYRAGYRLIDGRPALYLLVHGYMPRFAHARYEVQRIFYPKNDGADLEATFTCHIIRANGQRQLIAEFKQEFYRVCDEDELKDLLEFTSNIF